MPESISEFLEKRGAMGILVQLSTEGSQRFTDLDNALFISTATLTKRLGEARELGLVTPGMDPKETSVDDEYRITDRGKLLSRRMERQGMLHRYRTILDYRRQIEREMADLQAWIAEHQDDFAELDGTTPYQDAFGEPIPDRGPDPEYPDEFMEEETLTKPDDDDEEENDGDEENVEVWGGEPGEDATDIDDVLE